MSLRHIYRLDNYRQLSSSNFALSHMHRNYAQKVIQHAFRSHIMFCVHLQVLLFHIEVTYKLLYSIGDYLLKLCSIIVESTRTPRPYIIGRGYPLVAVSTPKAKQYRYDPHQHLEKGYARRWWIWDKR